MPRAHKRSSRGKADRQMRAHMQARKKKREQADAIEKARKRAAALAAEPPFGGPSDKYANYPGNRVDVGRSSLTARPHE